MEIAQEKIKSGSVAIVTLNKSENVDSLFSSWQSLIKNPRLMVFFVNPKSSADQKWVIIPATHELITENSVLKRGLYSLMESVPVYGE